MGVHQPEATRIPLSSISCRRASTVSVIWARSKGADTPGPPTRLGGYVSWPNVLVMHVEAQPTKFTTQIVYLSQPPADRFVTQAWARVALVVKKAALQECHFPRYAASQG
jgi:hypothetical protein